MLHEAIVGVPPGLRPSNACRNCKSFDSSTGSCALYSLKVSEDDYCDAYKPTKHHQSRVEKALDGRNKS
jgi:hypothetical protein